MPDIHEFYSEIVSPYVRDFEEDRASLRKAYGAVWALDSFASHIFYFLKHSGQIEELKDDRCYKKKVLKPESPDYGILLEVSNATKHAVRSNKAPVNTSDEVRSGDVSGYSAWFAGIGSEDWGKQVFVHSEEHRFRPLLPVVLSAERYLLSRLPEKRRPG